jgi:hypothetical protein
MTKQTKMILGGVAVLGLAYYLLNRGKGMANMTGMGLEMSDFANAQGRRLCVHVNPNGSTSEYSPIGGSRCYSGDRLN